MRWQPVYLAIFRPGVMAAICFIAVASSIGSYVVDAWPALFPMAPGNYDDLVLPLVVAVLWACYGYAALMWELGPYKAGARYPARSKDEAAILFHMTDAEEQRYLRSTAPLSASMVLFVVWMLARTTLRYQIEVLFEVALFLPFPWLMWIMNANAPHVSKILESTAYAKANGITKLQRPFYDFFRVSDHYRNAIRTLDDSPFER